MYPCFCRAVWTQPGTSADSDTDPLETLHFPFRFKLRCRLKNSNKTPRNKHKRNSKTKLFIVPGNYIAAAVKTVLRWILDRYWLRVKVIFSPGDSGTTLGQPLQHFKSTRIAEFTVKRRRRVTAGTYWTGKLFSWNAKWGLKKSVLDPPPAVSDTPVFHFNFVYE